MELVIKTPMQTSTVYLGEIEKRLAKQIGETDFVLTDENVYALHKPFFKKWFSGVATYVMHAGEAEKSFAMSQTVLEKMVGAGVKRTSKLFAVGGGVVGDMGGFCAALYMRGIDCVQVPTTLLAMVDSSVGGKTAVDFCGVKNVVGAFHSPVESLVDTGFLNTLPDREWKSGLGEVVKYAALDGEIFEKLKAGVSKESMVALIEKCIRFKAGVVERDEREQGERICLNLGHTTAHAIELLCGLSHGECVLLGMKIETLLAVRLGVCDKAYGEELIALVDSALAWSSKTEYALPAVEMLAQKAAMDKKNTGAGGIVAVVAAGKGRWAKLTLKTEEYAVLLAETLCKL